MRYKRKLSSAILIIMIDPELKEHLEIIEKEIVDFKKSSNSLSKSFMRGTFYGAGYIVGIVIIIVLVGWVLNIVGVIPAFNAQVQEFKAALDRVSGPLK